jgi:hypothetical protein
MLFIHIDSSHVLKIGADVVFLYQEVLSGRESVQRRIALSTHAMNTPWNGRRP